MTLEEEIYNAFIKDAGNTESNSKLKSKELVEKFSILYEESKKKDGGKSYINAYNKYINRLKEVNS